MLPHDESPEQVEPQEVSQTWGWLTLTGWFSELEAVKVAVQAAQVTLVGFLCGYFLRSNDWIHIGWLLCTLPVVFVLIPWNRLWRELRGDAFTLLGVHFLAWMTLRSLIAQASAVDPAIQEALEGMLGTGLLVALALVIWQAAGQPDTLEQSGRWVGLSAVLAALGSMVLFYLVLPDHQIGERLNNWFIYGGLNSVSTGLTLGFASLWLACIRDKAGTPVERHLITAGIVILLIAVFFTRSRGAILALVAGHGALLMVRGVRRSRVPLLLFGTVALAFQFSGPLVTRLAEMQTAARTREAFQVSNAQEFIGPPPVYHNPMAEMINRWDSGRFDIYAAGRDTLDGMGAWVAGIGQWCTDDLWRCGLEGNPNHLHSAFLATLVHGGLIGLALLLALLAVGLQRCYRAATQGQDTWLILLAFGLASMVFDGQTFTSLLSMPRMESFLVVFPLVAGVAAYAALKQEREADVE